ncbi:beta-N-acetylhexosaminidase [Caldanaerobius polysaccharolyticus]|uniref:beta-N-acetylhexosaminidase n=1 Tax=Caldanaerobius polysaccharolyticus TaxID=44256 RepID=UPI00047C482B|nr:beta-N-acetylhexosaminidase [Caldanaerobius polysaccharolyticus]
MVNIVPQPKSIRFTGQWFAFDGFSNMPCFLAQTFSIPKGCWTIEKIDKKGCGISIEDGKIKIWGDQNIAYATIIQLLMQRKDALPEVVIEEDFCFPFRGYHLDIARGGVPSVSTFKDILNWLFLLKYNYFAIYLEDLFSWQKYPQIGSTRGRLLQEELKEIIEHGRKLGIEVLPSVELAGHMEQILMLPEFSKYSEWHLPREGCLDLSDNEARGFAYELLEEVLEFFPSKYIHIGGDETWALGRGKSLDKTWTFQGPMLYEYHYRNMIEMVEKYGKIPIVWGDMVTGMYLRSSERKIWESILKSDIWDRVIIANWDYSAQTKEFFLNKIESFGSQRQDKQIVCPGLSNWGRFYPDFHCAIENLKNFIGAAVHKKLPGFFITAWGDDGEECLFSYLKPLLLAGMELAEGSGQWEQKWISLSGEDGNVLRVRKAFGRAEITNNIKHLLFADYWYYRMSESDKTNIKQVFEEVTQESSKVNLPEDLWFIRQVLRVCLKRLEGNITTSDLLELANAYARLWLAERKSEGLEIVEGKFWSAAGRVDLSIR